MRRSKDKAEALAAALGEAAEVADYADVAAGRVQVQCITLGRFSTLFSSI